MTTRTKNKRVIDAIAKVMKDRESFTTDNAVEALVHRRDCPTRTQAAAMLARDPRFVVVRYARTAQWRVKDGDNDE